MLPSPAARTWCAARCHHRHGAADLRSPPAHAAPARRRAGRHRRRLSRAVPCAHRAHTCMHTNTGTHVHVPCCCPQCGQRGVACMRGGQPPPPAPHPPSATLLPLHLPLHLPDLSWRRLQVLRQDDVHLHARPTPARGTQQAHACAHAEGLAARTAHIQLARPRTCVTGAPAQPVRLGHGSGSHRHSLWGTSRRAERHHHHRHHHHHTCRQKPKARSQPNPTQCVQHVLPWS